MPARHVDAAAAARSTRSPSISRAASPTSAFSLGRLAPLRESGAAHAAARGRRRGGYRDPGGEQELRLGIARYLAFSRAVVCNWQDVIVTQGAQQALDLLARVVLQPGDVAAVEEPGYPPARALFAALGAKIAHVPVDGEGLIVRKLPRERAARLRDAVAPVSARHADEPRAACRTAGVGGAPRRGDRRGRLRRRIPLRGAADGTAQEPRPRGARGVCRHVFEDDLPGLADRLRGAAGVPVASRSGGRSKPATGTAAC